MKHLFQNRLVSIFFSVASIILFVKFYNFENVEYCQGSYSFYSMKSASLDNFQGSELVELAELIRSHANVGLERAVGATNIETLNQTSPIGNYTLFEYALFNANYEGMRILLNAGVDVLTPTRDRTSPVLTCLYLNDRCGFKAIIDSHFDLNTRVTLSGKKRSFYTVLMGNLSHREFVLGIEQGMRIDERAGWGEIRFALGSALASGQFENIKFALADSAFTSRLQDSDFASRKEFVEECLKRFEYMSEKYPSDDWGSLSTALLSVSGVADN